MLGCSPILDECVLKDEGLRKEILSKTHHSLHTVHLRSTKKYKDEERSELEFSTYLSSSLLQATFGIPPYEALYGGYGQCWMPRDGPIWWRITSPQ